MSLDIENIPMPENRHPHGFQGTPVNKDSISKQHPRVSACQRCSAKDVVVKEGYHPRAKVGSAMPATIPSGKGRGQAGAPTGSRTCKSEGEGEMEGEAEEATGRCICKQK